MIPFADEKDAIRIANDVRYGLMATVWTGDPARGHRVASRIKAGTVGINTPYTAFPGIPFGGYKQSGFGRELGLETLDLYLETKSVLVSTGESRSIRSGSNAPASDRTRSRTGPGPSTVPPCAAARSRQAPATPLSPDVPSHSKTAMTTPCRDPRGECPQQVPSGPDGSVLAGHGVRAEGVTIRPQSGGPTRG